MTYLKKVTKIENPLFSDNFNINVFNNIFEKKVQRDNEIVKFNIPQEYNRNDNQLLGVNGDPKLYRKCIW